MRDDETGRYQIDHPAEAAWAIAKVARARQLRDAVKDSKRDAAARLDSWAKDQLRPVDRNDAFFTGLLCDWYAAQIPAEILDDVDSAQGRARWEKFKPKSVSFPTGKVWARRDEGGYRIVDVELWEEWVMEHLFDEQSREQVERVLSAFSTLRELTGGMVGLSVAFGQPPHDHPMFRHDGETVKAIVATGEMVDVPALKWAPATISFGVTPTKGVEHPAWDPAPVDSTLPDEAPEGE